MEEKILKEEATEKKAVEVNVPEVENKDENAPEKVADDGTKDFLNDEENKKRALELAYQVLSIVDSAYRESVKADNKAGAERIIEKMDGEKVYKKSVLVKHSTLSYSKATNLLNTLYAFGLIRYTKTNVEFVFTLTRENKVNFAKAEFSAVLNGFAEGVKRFKAVMGEEYDAGKIRELVEAIIS